MTSRHPAVSCACPKCQSERRTTPPPTAATDEREAVARALCELHIRNVRRHDTDATTLEAVLPGAIEMHWFDFQLEADAALSALAPIRAAEILAAEANERARIAILLEALVDISKAAMIAKAMCDDADREPWQMIADRARKAIDAHLGRNEHGAGK